MGRSKDVCRKEAIGENCVPEERLKLRCDLIFTVLRRYKGCYFFRDNQ
jgi:hypothetical protein